MRKVTFSIIFVTVLVVGYAVWLLFQRTVHLPSLPKIKKLALPVEKVVASNLEIPWAIAFLPDGSLLFTERAGRLSKVHPDGNSTPKLIANISDVAHIGEGGLLGVEIDPDFTKNSFIYLYFTYQATGNRTLNRVVRFELKNDTLLNRKVLIDAIPGASNHNGGRLKFGPGGYLYITTGDAQEPSLSQDTTSLAGKILRAGRDGKVEVYSYGHRNPQGLAWDPSNSLYAPEHGSLAYDEVNKIIKGANYGWPTVRGDETRSGLTPPLVHSGPSTWAPSGAAILNGKLYFAGLRGSALFELDLKTNKLKELLQNKFGRIRDVVVGPDEFLYITTSNRDGRGTPSQDDDKILRINPSSLK